jgi:hypothetical protein
VSLKVTGFTQIVNASKLLTNAIFTGIFIFLNHFKNRSWKDTQDPAACNTNPDVYMKFSRDPERYEFI